MKIGVQIIFRTEAPLSQAAGMRFWENAHYFTAIAGGRRYQMTTAGEADSLDDGISGAIAIIKTIVADDLLHDDVVIEKVTAELV